MQSPVSFFLQDQLFLKAKLSSVVVLLLFLLSYGMARLEGISSSQCNFFLISFVALTLLRLLLINIYQMQKTIRGKLVEKLSLAHGYLFLCHLMALVWSGWIWVLIDQSGLNGQAFMIGLIITAGISAGSTLSLSSHPIAHKIFLGAIHLWTFHFLFNTSFDYFSSAITGLCFIYLLYLAQLSRYIYSGHTQNYNAIYESKEEFNKLSAILENLPGIVSLLDNDLRYLFVSSKVSQLFDGEMNKSKFIGQKIGWSGRNPVFKDLVESFCESEQTFLRTELLLNTTNGQEKWHEVYLSKKAVKDGILIFSLNIDERIKLLEQLKNEQNIRIESSKLASIGLMAAGIAHEINNPLSIITGKISLINKKIDQNRFEPTTLKNDLDKIELTALKISKIIKGLRSFSRDAEDGELTLVKFEEIFEDALSVCRERALNRQIELKIESHFDDKILTNIIATNQIFFNLMVNSIDAVEELPEKWIHLKGQLEGQNLVIDFVDSGKGIPKEHQDSIWQPFFTTKPVGKGTGLGLGICRNLTEKLKGSIQIIDSSEQTHFRITLPLDPR